MLGLFKYSQTTGDVLFEHFTNDLAVGNVMWGSSIGAGWNVVPFYTAIHPINPIIDCYLLFYNPGSGAVQIQAATPKGLKLIWQGQWSHDPSWTHLVPVWKPGIIAEWGDSYMFSFKKATGEAALEKLNDEGKGTTNVFTRTWKQPWTCFASGNITGGDPYLLMYSAKTGHAELDDITNSEEVVYWERTWTNTPPWTHMEPLTSDLILYYKQDDGTVEVDRLLDKLRDGVNKPGSTPVWKDQWAAGWTNFSPFVAWMGVLPEAFLLSYKASDGSLALDRFSNVEGEGFSSVWKSGAGRGWSHIFALRV